jgi:transcriptional regulator with XRE-family HTH domain
MQEMLIYSMLGEAVAIRRKAMRLTQAELSERMGLSRASIANIEAGRQKVLLDQVYTLVECLGLNSITELLPQARPALVLETKSVPLSRDDISDKQKAQIDDAFMAIFGDMSADTVQSVSP